MLARVGTMLVFGLLSKLINVIRLGRYVIAVLKGCSGMLLTAIPAKLISSGKREIVLYKIMW